MTIKYLVKCFLNYLKNEKKKQTNSEKNLKQSIDWFKWKCWQTNWPRSCLQNTLQKVFYCI